MTNTVVQNFVANVCLATGAKPIMSENPEEAQDLASLGGALVINMGTAGPARYASFIAGMKAYNEAAAPIVFDPVGGGATSLRRQGIKTLMAAGFFSVIKGNESEIGAVAGASMPQQRGVDSGPSSSSTREKIDMVEALANREHCVVLMTGKTDYLSDGMRTVAIENGSPLLGDVTGSGCALGAVIASYVAVHPADKLVAALAAILHYEVAAERAEARDDCRGPGTFLPAFIDELSALGKEIETGRGVDAFEKLIKVHLVSGKD
jgi:thiamine-phosphate diphosphorylase/hydroxyethylthiazole kinase